MKKKPIKTPATIRRPNEIHLMEELSQKKRYILLKYQITKRLSFPLLAYSNKKSNKRLIFHS